MPTLDLRGTAYAYEEAGQGSALLLLHAGIADRRMWDDTWPMLTALPGSPMTTPASVTALRNASSAGSA